MSSCPRGCWVVMVSLSCRLISQASTSSVNPFSSCTGSQSNWQSYSMTYSSLRRRPESSEGVRARGSEPAWAVATAKKAADQQAQTTHRARGMAAVAAHRHTRQKMTFGRVMSKVLPCRGRSFRPRGAAETSLLPCHCSLQLPKPFRCKPVMYSIVAQNAGQEQNHHVSSEQCKGK